MTEVTRQHVIVAGSIGTGKTTLVRRLGEDLPGAVALEEQHGRYLAELYRDPTGYAFRNQLDFTLHLLERALAAPRGDLVIQERSIFDAHEVFSATLRAAGHIERRDFELLARVHRLAAARTAPKLLIFLEAPVAVGFERMRARQVPEEAMVTIDYLQLLHDAYARWYASFDLCRKVAFDTGAMGPTALAKAAAAVIASLRGR